MALTADQIFLLNSRMGKVGEEVQLGTLINNAYSDVGAPLPSGQIFVGNSSNLAAAVAVTGVLTISNTGVTALAAGGVLLASLGTGIKPSHVVKFAGKHVTTGGSATEAFTVTGVLSTDIVVATLQVAGGTARTLLTTAPTTDTVTCVFSGDPSTTHTVSYVVYRAAS